MLHITKAQIADLFHSFREGRELFEKCSQSDYEQVTKDEWLALRKSQNKQLSACYEKNAKLVREVWNPIKQNPDLISDELYDCLCDWLQDMYEENYDDPYTLYEIASFLLKHYENCEKENFDRFIFSLKACAFGELDMSRTADHKRGRESVRLFRRIIGYRYRLHEMKEEASRTAVFSAYSNLLRVEASLKNMSVREAYEIWKQFVEYRNDPYSHQYDEEIPRIVQMCTLLDKDFRCYAVSDYYNAMVRRDGTLSERFDPKFFKELAEMCQAYLYSIMGEGDITRLKSGNLYYYYNYEELLALEGKQTWRETFYHMRDFTQEHLEELARFNETEDWVSAITEPVFRLIEALNYSDLTKDEKNEYALYYCDLFIRLAKRFNTMEYSYALNMSLADFCFHRPLLQCIESAEKKEQLFINLLLARHPSTYMHSVMVQKITLMILDEVLKQHPEYLVGLLKTKDVQQVLQKQAQIRKFAARAAIFHDTGKNRIIDIIVTEHRKINDEEFAAIKRHPQLGAEFLSIDPAFHAYRDVALGHHRFYDGKGGYPMIFDNRKSVDKPLIDLITISDCVDAATDYMSRNFQRAKTLEQVLEELKTDAGTRYHPGYVELLVQDQALFARIEQLVSHERENIYYAIFKQCQTLDWTLSEENN